MCIRVFVYCESIDARKQSEHSFKETSKICVQQIWRVGVFGVVSLAPTQ